MWTVFLSTNQNRSGIIVDAYFVGSRYVVGCLEELMLPTLEIKREIEEGFW